MLEELLPRAELLLVLHTRSNSDIAVNVLSAPMLRSLALVKDNSSIESIDSSLAALYRDGRAPRLEKLHLQAIKWPDTFRFLSLKSLYMFRLVHTTAIKKASSQLWKRCLVSSIWN